MNLDKNFKRYTAHGTEVPVWCITPDTNGAIHRFFDTSPISPSGRFVALTVLPSEEKLPRPGDVAHILLVDLETGTQKIIAETRGYDTQLGAQVQWGESDTELFYNDVNLKSWEPFGVKLNIFTGEKKPLEGTLYMVSPDGKKAVSACLKRIGQTQAGYGVVVPNDFIPINRGAPEDDYITITDTETGKCSNLLSIHDVVASAIPKIDCRKYGEGDFYNFHVKWSPDGQKIMLVLRYLGKEGRYPQLITFDADGSNIHVAVPASIWAEQGGHHPNWFPDSRRILININDRKDGIMRFATVNYDGSDYKYLTDKVRGSGHPSFHKDMKYLITDAYQNEIFAHEDGTTPIRFIRLEDMSEREIIRINTKPHSSLGELRVDPHPVWDRTFTKIVFNACPDGYRKVYLADLEKMIR